MSGKYVSKILYVISFAWQLGFLVAIPLALLLFLGVFLDKYFQTFPNFILLGLFLSLLFIFYEIYQWLSPVLKEKKKIQKPK